VRSVSAALLALGLASCGSASPPPRAAVASDETPVLDVGGADLRVEIQPAARARSDEELLRWTERAATMVDAYCDGYPVPDVRVRIVSGRGIGWGSHAGGRRVRVAVGPDTSVEALERDWVLVHEMLHLAFPSLARRHRWMREGLSTYLETVLRARSGIYDEERVWRRWVRNMPNGVPRATDRGLDRTRSWGAVYWGGALFWLLVDVELRARTNNERSIRDVVRGALALGGNARVVWSTERVAEVADEVTGTTAFSELYAAHATQRGDVDLEALWARLGVVETEDGVRFDDDAPLAHVRRAMNAPVGPELPPISGRSPRSPGTARSSATGTRARRAGARAGG